MNGLPSLRDERGASTGRPSSSMVPVAGADFVGFGHGPAARTSASRSSRGFGDMKGKDMPVQFFDDVLPGGPLCQSEAEAVRLLSERRPTAKAPVKPKQAAPKPLPPLSAMAEAQDRATLLRFEDASLSQEQAMAQVWSDPDLYRRYLAEQQFTNVTAGLSPLPVGPFSDWADVEARARQLVKDGKFPSFAKALWHLAKRDPTVSVIYEGELLAKGGTR